VVLETTGTSSCAGQLAQDTFQFALCACEGIVLNAQLSVDAFDSTQGPYASPLDGGINILDDGQLGMNGGPLILEKKLTAAGSVFIGGGGLQMGPDSVIKRNLYVYGDLTESTNTSGTILRNAFVHGDVPVHYLVEGHLQVPPGALFWAPFWGTRSTRTFHSSCPARAVARLSMWGL
jgi:hypothetical protein